MDTVRSKWKKCALKWYAVARPESRSIAQLPVRLPVLRVLKQYNSHHASIVASAWLPKRTRRFVFSDLAEVGELKLSACAAPVSGLHGIFVQSTGYSCTTELQASRASMQLCALRAAGA